jgi:DNA invertase Pin-like site-specific DNA recombinase
LHESEVRAIAKSTAKWCRGRFDIQASGERFSKLQAHRGRKGGVASGVARLAASEGRRAVARSMRAEGKSYQQIAAALGVSRRSVIYWCNEAIIR